MKIDVNSKKFKIFIFLCGLLSGVLFFNFQEKEYKKTISELNNKIVNNIKDISLLENKIKNTNQSISGKITINKDGSMYVDGKIDNKIEEKNTSKLLDKSKEEIKQEQKSLSKEETKINPKKLRIEVGLLQNITDLHDRLYYLHCGYKLNPYLGVGGMTQSNLKDKHYVGAGLFGDL